MTSPDRIAMMEKRMSDLAEIARRLEQEEEQDREWMMESEARSRAHEIRIREAEARILESEARIQASENRLRENEAQLSEINARMRLHNERIRASQGEIRAIIAMLTEMQADIARIDAGS